MFSENKDYFIKMALLAEKAKRSEDMATAMKNAVKTGEQLSRVEREILADAYKARIYESRLSWTKLQNMQKNILDEHQLDMASQYQKVVGLDFINICNEILNMLEVYLLPRATTDEELVFYLRLKGDYYRYLGEIAVEVPAKIDIVNNAWGAYEYGYRIALAKLSPYNQVRLGFVLHYAIFHYHFLREPQKAVEMLEKTLEDAKGVVDDLKDELDSLNAIVYSCQFKLEEWSKEMNENEEDGVAGN